MSVSERISKRREELGLTQTELAKRAGLKPPAISQYESGVRSPSYEAIIKLSNALDITSDYLISGNVISSDAINEKTAKILFNIIQDMSIDKREILLQYAAFINNVNIIDFGLPTLNTPEEYADYIYKTYGNGSLPVDIYGIASKLGINIYRDEVQDEYEGLLLKSSEKTVIIVDKGINFEPRIKFTISLLLGHAVIPWHIKSHYYVRKKNTSTLHSDNIREIEAQKFAAYLLMPGTQFMKDLNKEVINMAIVKEIAEHKYGVSVTAFLNQMVDFYGDRYAYVQSKQDEIKTSHQGNRPIVDKVSENSVAYSFYNEPIPLSEEIRNAEVPANTWFLDAKENEIVYESSIFNPKFGTLTLIVSI